MRATVIGLAALLVVSCSDSTASSSDGGLDGSAAGAEAGGNPLDGGSTTGGDGGGTTGGDGAVDAPLGGGDSGSMTMADAAPGCPAQQPLERTPCSGSISCGYGQTTCCGTPYSFMTCKCQGGTFSCAMTIACNFVCPDAGGAEAP
jgi:hypothetical protein